MGQERCGGTKTGVYGAKYKHEAVAMMAFPPFLPTRRG